MVRFIKVVNAVDKVTDCIPIVSAVKNIGILLYQRIHKVNKVANPVKTSWTDDIKIHVLSKVHFGARIASIPFIGNLICLIVYVSYAIDKLTGSVKPDRPMGYLGKSSRRWDYGTKKHSYEITVLYLARNPNRSEEKQAKSLRFAAVTNNEEVFKLILNSRNWTGKTLKDSFKNIHNRNMVKLILDKCVDTLSNEDAGEILSSHCFIYRESDYPIIELLASKYPEMNIHCVGQALSRLAESRNAFKAIDFLLTRFPAISEEDRKKALLAASKKQNKETIELIEQETPDLVKNNLDQVLEIAANSYHGILLHWLFAKYKEEITPEHIGMALGKQAGLFHLREALPLFSIEKILLNYPDLPPEHLVPLMKTAAFRGSRSFEHFLNKFSQLKPEHLQDILNQAVYVYGKSDDLSEYTESWGQIAELIRSKFPEMKAEDPLNS